VERGIALHKLARLATVATAGHGYLTFMGNEFGHPEWVDFPRSGNNWSYHYSRRQWHLRDDPNLKYHFLADFDREMLRLFRGDAAPASSVPCLMHLHNDDKILAFARGQLVFVLNLHPTRSFENYGIPAPPGEYTLIMDSDEERFGGLGRIAPAQRYVAIPVGSAAPDRHQVLLYLPARTALVLRAPA
jgi:1,4-alpha-glucan branching enzyme